MEFFRRFFGNKGETQPSSEEPSAAEEPQEEPRGESIPTELLDALASEGISTKELDRSFSRDLSYIVRSPNVLEYYVQLTKQRGRPIASVRIDNNKSIADIEGSIYLQIKQRELPRSDTEFNTQFQNEMFSEPFNIAITVDSAFDVGQSPQINVLFAALRHYNQEGKAGYAVYVEKGGNIGTTHWVNAQTI